jgi:hypothetical protein
MIEVTESGAHGDTDVIPVVPSFLGEVHLRWKGCGCHKGLTNATKAHPILWCKLPPQRPSSLSTKGFLKAEPAFTILGHTSTTKLEAPKHNTMLSINK